MKKLSGFTLVELIVVVFIFSLILIAIFGVLIIGRQSWNTGTTQIDLQEEMRKGMDRMVKDLRESRISTVTIFEFVDPINGEQHQSISFASARGDPDDPDEDEVLNNNGYFHLDAGRPSWRSLVIYCTYQTSYGQKQLRKYTDYDTMDYSVANTFPFTFLNITAGQITLESANATPITVSINRDPDQPTVLASYVETEDTNLNEILDSNEDDGYTSLPADNNDTVLDTGSDFTKNANMINIKLFLRKKVIIGHFLVTTLNSTVKLRN